MMTTLTILLAALVLDWFLGDPDWLWRRLPHPVVWFGKAVDFCDRSFNRDGDPSDLRYRKGCLVWAGLVIATIVAGYLLGDVLRGIGLIGLAGEIGLVAVLLAQGSLRDHVRAVADALTKDGVAGARKTLAMIVGRDTTTLDRSGISRAALESLAENFSDGVVAPAFWYAVFGLPGLLAYKMINTADSMIGHKTPRHLYFGRCAAQTDDLANWLPARLSALLLAIAAGLRGGRAAAQRALNSAMADHGHHESPNAGWPEAALAGGLGVALGGPRRYRDRTVDQAWLNASGRDTLHEGDINDGLVHFRAACMAGWALTGLMLALGAAGS